MILVRILKQIIQKIYIIYKNKNRRKKKKMDGVIENLGNYEADIKFYLKCEKTKWSLRFMENLSESEL